MTLVSAVCIHNYTLTVSSEMDGGALADRNPSFLLSSKCKFVGLLTLMIVAIEIYSVQRWESASVIIPSAYKTEQNSQYYLDVENFENPEAKDEGNMAVTSQKEKPFKVNPHTEMPPEPDNISVDQIDESQTKKEEKIALDKKSNQYTYAVRKYLELEDELKKHLEKAVDKKV